MPDPTAAREWRRARLAAARLYLVCDAQPAGRNLDEILRAAIGGGVDIVQLREKRLSGRELIDAARIARNVCSERGVLFLVNDDPEIALAVGADGVHVGQRDMPVAAVRELVGADMLIGLSTHTRAEIERICESVSADASEAGPVPAAPDYIGVGPVYATPTKAGRPAVGPELVSHADRRCEIPFFAIGGIDARRAPAVLAAGATRIAVVRAIADAGDPERAARALHRLLAQRDHHHDHEHERTRASASAA